jgi:hypothetical protein
MPLLRTDSCVFTYMQFIKLSNEPTADSDFAFSLMRLRSSASNQRKHILLSCEANGKPKTIWKAFIKTKEGIPQFSRFNWFEPCPGVH